MNKETELSGFIQDYLRCKADVEGSFNELSDLFYTLCQAMDGEVQQELLNYWNITSGHLRDLLDKMNQVAKK